MDWPGPDTGRTTGSISRVTDGFQQWVVGLPVWFQTPLVLGALACVAVVVAAALLWLLTKVVPFDAEERHAFGRSEDDQGGGDRQ